MSNTFEPRIIVLSPNSLSHLFKNLSGDTFVLNEDESPILSLTLPFEEIKTLFPNLKRDYRIKWMQPPLISHLGRELWKTLANFQPNIFFIFLDQNTDFDFYKGILQNLYIRLLENLDDNIEKAEKKARDVKIEFLIFYKHRSTVIHHLVQLMLFFNSFKKIFTTSELHEKKIESDEMTDIEIIQTLIWCWELFSKKI